MTEPDILLTVSKLPDGKFTLSTDPQRALSEVELRVELGKTVSRADIIGDLIRRAKQTP
jgi:hypothetical protein